MLRNIENCYINNKIVSFYDDKDYTNAHYTGFIAAYNDSEILINHITPSGYYDGYILKRIEDIFRVDYDGNYEIKIEKLYNLRNQHHQQITFIQDEILYTLMDFAIQNKLIISLEFCNDTLSGFIIDYQDEVITLEIIDEFGKSHGISVVNLNEVDVFYVDTDDEQDLKLLHEHIVQEDDSQY